MGELRCLHLNRSSAVIQTDLSRLAETASVYSTQITAGICEACGQVELYCEFHRDVCGWLNATAPSNKQ